MKKSLPLAFIVLASTSVSTAFAADNWYLGALYNTQEISMNGRDFNTAGVVTGYHYNEYLALEARLSKGTSGYSTTYGTPKSSEGDYKEDIDTQGSLLIKASYPIFESLSFYALAGYTKTKLEINGVGSTNDSNGNIIGNFSFKHTESDSGFSYGVGLNYQISEQFNMFVDYQVLPDFEPQANFSKTWKSIAIGVSYSF